MNRKRNLLKKTLQNKIKTPKIYYDMMNTITCIREGMHRNEVIDKIMKENKYTRENALTEYSKAVDIIRENFNEFTKESSTIITERYAEIYQRCMKNGEYQVALNSLKELSNLQGLTKQYLQFEFEEKIVLGLPNEYQDRIEGKSTQKTIDAVVIKEEIKK